MASFSGIEDGLQMLLLCNGLNADDLAAVIENLKNASKNVGQHKRRELYWEGYTAMASSCSTIDGAAYCLIKYSTFDGEGTAECTELTKRQKGLVSGGCDIVGCKKHKPDADGEKAAAAGGGASGWVAAWSEDDAKAAYEDRTHQKSKNYENFWKKEFFKKKLKFKYTFSLYQQ